MQPSGTRSDPPLRSVLLLAGGVAGMALCITLVYLAMRSVMDIGGACADGGPYVSANPCPDGAALAMFVGAFGLFLFGGLAIVGANGVGGYGWVPLIAWTGLFASLGWNFLDYGLVHPPEGEGTAWGFVIPGVMFQVMAWVPVVVLVWGLRSQRRWRERSPFETVVEPGHPLRHPAEDAEPMRPPPVPDSHRVEVAGGGRQAELQAIDGAMGALVLQAPPNLPVEPSGPTPADRQVLFEHLEKLGEMRTSGLLTEAEFAAAKDAVMRALEGQP